MLLTLGQAHAQSDNNGDRRITSSYYISNATVIPEPGIIHSNYDIIFKNGTISEIGKNLTIPKDAKEIKGESLFVYPGFIDLGNKSGVEIPVLPERPEDFDTSNPIPELAGIHPHFSAAKHYQFNEKIEEDWRGLGFTIVQKIPEGKGMLPGLTTLVVMGHEGNNNLLTENPSQFFQFNTVRGVYPHTKLAVMAKWRDLFQNTVLYREHMAIYAKNKGIGRVEFDPVLNALIPVTQNQTPLLIAPKSELDTRRALKMLEENNFKLVLLGINEGAELIPILHSKKVGVVLNLALPEDKFSDSLDNDEQGTDYDARIERARKAFLEPLSLASKYEKAGIPFAFTSMDLEKKDFYSNLRLMIDNGLSKDAALAALTMNPAKILGIENISGSIAPGKMANLILMTDSLFSKDGKVSMVVSDGYLFDYPDNISSGKLGSQVWNYATETPVGQSKGTWEFVKKDDKWEGTVSYDSPKGTGVKKAKMENLELTDESLSFSFIVETNDDVLDVTVDGVIKKNNKFEGSMNIKGYTQFTVQATKDEKPNKDHE
ncbi:Amidohydrolase family protein [Cyclobacterium qasimii M12-11B]|uniref:Amidohydrolase family protein n=1 Tax=Cyclobacterium qasimii M12-11B TaxID=641524 RepID=S7X698_9BACT|nr:Amidohydrolase family protein [Cyclobacterium qasimii M12-11B]